MTAVHKKIETTSYNGGKNGNGVYQSIINHVPEHDTFVTLFAGHCGLFRNIKRAGLSIVNDVDNKIFRFWSEVLGDEYGCCVSQGNAIDILEAKLIGLHQLDKPGVFIYLDPPYKFETRRFKGNLYNYELTDADHERLIKAIMQFKHAKIMVSHYSCFAYDALINNGWNYYCYVAATRQGPANETIYFNYPKPEKLQDYNYIGDNFRKRERLKRIKVNLMKKLDRIEPVLRNSILTDLLSHYNAMGDQH